MLIDTRVSGNAPPVWLLAVVGSDDVPVAMVGIEPTTDELYNALHKRMRAGGFATVRPHEWSSAKWGMSRTSAVDVVGNDLVRITTGLASVYTGAPMPVSDRWVGAARARRALVALIVPGTLGGPAVDDEKQQRLAELVERRRLLGTMAPVRFDLPVSRPS